MTQAGTTKTIDGETYTLTADGDYATATGQLWAAFEIDEIRDVIADAGRELASIDPATLTDYDVAARWMTAKDRQIEAEESLRIAELLFGAI